MQIMVNGALVTGSKLLLIIFLLFSFSSCKKENMGDCFKGTGEIIMQERNISTPFNTIEIDDNISVILTQSTEYSIKVEAGKNLMDLIETDLKNNVLTLRNKNKCNWMRSYDKPVNVHISLPDLVSLQYRSAGDVTATNTFIVDSLNLEVWGGAGSVTMNVDCRVAVYAIHTGTGDLRISGKTIVSYIWNSGNGYFYGRDLQTEFAYMDNRGTGDCYIYPKIILGVTILHIGNIYYKGDPEVTADIRGSGKLIKLE